MAVVVAGLLGASATIYRYKVRHGLTCTFCMKKEEDNTGETESITLE